MANTTLESAPALAPSRTTIRDWSILLALALAGVVLRYAVFHFGLGGGSFSDFVHSLCRWDCGWYESVSRGYHTASDLRRGGEANWAFFPLYPMLVRAVQIPTGADWAHAGFFLSNLFGVLSAAAVRPLVRGGDRPYWLFAFGLLLGPFSYLFSLPYTESLFILLTVLSLRALQRSDYVATGAWGALLSGTRVTGLMIGVAIVVQGVVDRLREGTRLAQLPFVLLSDRRLLLACLLVPLGLIALMLHLRFIVGDGLAFSHVQFAWGRTIGNPVEHWLYGVRQGWPFTDRFGLFAIHAWMAGFAVLLAGWLAAQRRWAVAAFCVAAMVISMSTGLTSFTRFVAGLVPLGFPIAELIGKSRWGTWLAIPVALALGLGTTYGWLSNWNQLI